MDHRKDGRTENLHSFHSADSQTNITNLISNETVSPTKVYMRMCISAIFDTFCVFYVHSASEGLITEKVKLSQDTVVNTAVQNDACFPGIWTCSTKKRSEIGKAFWETTFALEETSPLNIPQDCPPGMWVCKNKRMSKEDVKDSTHEIHTRWSKLINASNDKKRNIPSRRLFSRPGQNGDKDRNPKCGEINKTRQKPQKNILLLL